ncbi:trypsin-like peptidase domain-containing protein [Pedobacter immunditicola]|uniref:trypsin-like peptidase domain-containing protein n=1 Tax=Pedobacter immunditicola TaxID=3133440 RepID=UPI0030A2DFB8
MKKTTVSLFAILLSMTTVLLFSCKNNPADDEAKGFPQSSSPNNQPSNANNLDFVPAAKAVTPGVVHIKTLYQNRSSGNLPSAYGGGNAPSGGSGSGVVISSDGYIATNNHVIEDATQIEVIFTDRRTFIAKLVGRDPNTDLALLKVDEKDLPVVELGNSDNIEVGEWVLAVGYPFSLNTTVTAGIVSAKGRSIGIINSNSSGSPQANTAIESFIQTDAAINPGNSGGALVDMNGKLVGINTAIASLTGSYAGYAFAIPVNLAKKILDDLKQFGEVKRGLLGVSFPAPSVEDQYLKQQGIKPGSVKGVFITGIQKGSAADAAGLQKGDIIQSIDGNELFSSAEFSERIARHRPGDKVELKFLRNGKSNSTSATLKAEEPKKLLASDPEALEEIYNRLGAVFAPLTPELKERYNLKAGVVVTQVRIGGFFHQLGIPPGTIIAYINGRGVSSPEDIDRALVAAQNSRVQIIGIAPDGSRIAFDFSLGA